MRYYDLCTDPSSGPSFPVLPLEEESPPCTDPHLPPLAPPAGSPYTVGIGPTSQQFTSSHHQATTA